MESNKSVMDKVMPYAVQVGLTVATGVLIAWGMMSEIKTRVDTIERDATKHELVMERELKRIEGDIAKHEIAKERELKRIEETENRLGRLEVLFENLCKDIMEVKTDVKTLLQRGH